MRLRTVAEFETDLPDDSAEEDRDIVIFPGKNLAEIVAAHLRAVGYQVTDPEHAHEHGWSLRATGKMLRVWLQISRIDDDECYLHIANTTPWWKNHRDRFATFLMRLADRLKDEPHMIKLIWFADDRAMDKKGGSSPLWLEPGETFPQRAASGGDQTP